MRAYVALAVSVILNSAALLQIKMVVVNLPAQAEAHRFSTILMSAAVDPFLWGAGSSFLAGMYFWVVSLKSLDLSLAYPTASISYIFIAITSHLIFGETLGASRIVGMLIIIAGVFVLYGRPRERA